MLPVSGSTCNGAQPRYTLSESDVIPPGTDDDGLPPLPIEDRVPSLPLQGDKRTLSNIKKFDSNKECQCLECGYNGLMGVVRNKMNPGAAVLLGLLFGVIAFVVSVVFIFGVMEAGGAPLTSTFTSIFPVIIALTVAGWSINFMRNLSEKKVLFCPNCEKEIIEK